MDSFNNLLVWINDKILSLPLIVVILATGIYLTVRLRCLQVRRLPSAFAFIFKKESTGKGEVSSFGALCTALSATIGTGNIVGVATAVVSGGPGALFWMWIAAFFGMATKYAEGVLAVKYRTIDKDGHVLGGPFYYIEKGMGERWRWLGRLFAFFGAGVGLLGIGTFTQVNSISSAVNNLFDAENNYTVNLFGKDYSWTVIITGIALTIITGLVIIGGLKRISHVSEVIVPFMSVLYFVFCLILIILNAGKIPAAIVAIVQSAFGIRPIVGGALGTIMVAMQKGIARGVFSNEAGLGSAPIAAAAAKTNEPVRQGLISMTGTFIDTLIICTMTGLCIMLTDSWNIGLEGVAVTANAFKNGLPFNPQFSNVALVICLIFFAFTTILGWDYYGERCVEYLFHGSKRAVKIYRWLYILAIFIGPFMTVKAVWTIADIFNTLMALPNLVALLALSGVITAETRAYFKKKNAASDSEQAVEAADAVENVEAAVEAEETAE